MENRVYCLYRVSTRKQADFNAENQADIPMQRKACREFAGQMGWEIIYEGQEAGVSGFKVSEKDRMFCSGSKNTRSRENLIFCLCSCLTVLAAKLMKVLSLWSGS